MLILDVDGVMTDGGIILDSKGNELKSFHVRDGHGIKLFQRAGHHVAIITGRRSGVVDRRARELGIREVHQKCYDKSVAYEKILKKYNLKDREIAYVGDDIVDIPLLRRVGLPVAVADADEEIMDFVLMVTRRKGGRGAVREVTDFILRAKGLWQEIFNEYIEV